MAEPTMKRFSGAIPGVSLTQTPKNAPWERPPEINKPDEAIEFHLRRLSDPDAMEKALYLLESDFVTLEKLTQGLVRAAVANGVHSVDMGLIVAPVLHEFIKQTADSVGVEYDEGFEDKTKKEKAVQDRVRSKAKKMLRDAGFKLPAVTMEDVVGKGEEMAAEAPMAEEMPMPEEAPAMEQAPVKRGLMSKGGM